MSTEALKENQEPKVELSKEQTTALTVIKATDLAHLDELDNKIKNWKRKYSKLKIEDENDKEGIEAHRVALGEMRPVRTGLDAQRKSVTEPYRNAVNYINDQYAKKIDAIAAIEEPLKSRKKEVEDLIEKKKEEEKIAQEKKVNDRINELINAGCAFDGTYYSIKSEVLGIDETSIGVVDVRSMSDELYKNFLQVVLDKSAKIKLEEERIAKEKEQAELLQKEKEKQERELFEQQQKEMQRKEKEMQEREDAMKKQMEEIEKHKKMVQYEKEMEAKATLKRIIDQRTLQLTESGMIYNSTLNSYQFSGIEITKDQIETLTHEDWDALYFDKKVLITERKIELEKKANEQRLAEEQRIKQKAVEEEQERQRQEKIKQEELLSAANDKTKWEALVEQLMLIQLPEMKSPKYKAMVNPIRDLIDNL